MSFARISLEGNLAAGKSTLLSVLAEQGLALEVAQEPVAQWQHVSGDEDNILELFYKDPKRWAHTF